MISVTGWDRFQHYRKPKPPWVKLYRDLLGDYEFLSLDEADRWLLIGLWLMAAETDNRIPADLAWITRRLHLNDIVSFQRLATLETLGFIEVGESSRLPLDKPYSKTEVEVEVEVEVEKEKEKEPPPTPPEAFLRDFEEFWSAYPLKIGKKKALKAYQARRRQKTEHADIMAGLVRYLHWAEATDTKLKHAATFVGPDEHWKETWTVTDADTAKKGNGQPPGFAESRFQKEFVPDIRPRPDKVPGWATDTVLEAPNVEMPTKKPDPAQTAAAVEEQKRKLAELVRDQ